MCTCWALDGAAICFVLHHPRGSRRRPLGQDDWFCSWRKLYNACLDKLTQGLSFFPELYFVNVYVLLTYSMYTFVARAVGALYMRAELTLGAAVFC